MRFEARFHAPGLKAPERAMPVLGGEAVGPFEIRWFRLIFWRSIAQSLNGFKGKTAGGFLRARASLNPFERFNHPSCPYAWLLIHKQANLNKS